MYSQSLSCLIRHPIFTYLLLLLASNILFKDIVVISLTNFGSSLRTCDHLFTPLHLTISYSCQLSLISKSHPEIFTPSFRSTTFFDPVRWPSWSSSSPSFVATSVLHLAIGSLPGSKSIPHQRLRSTMTSPPSCAPSSVRPLRLGHRARKRATASLLRNHHQHSRPSTQPLSSAYPRMTTCQTAVQQYGRALSRW